MTQWTALASLAVSILLAVLIVVDRLRGSGIEKASIENSIASLRDTIVNQGVMLTTQIAALATQIAEVKGENKERSKQIDELKDRVTRLEEQVKAIDSNCEKNHPVGPTGRYATIGTPR